MAHLKKRVTFAGVDYILVPVELWDEAKGLFFDGLEGAHSYDRVLMNQMFRAMKAYEGTDEVEDSNV